LTIFVGCPIFSPSVASSLPSFYLA